MSLLMLGPSAQASAHQALAQRGSSTTAACKERTASAGLKPYTSIKPWSK